MLQAQKAMSSFKCQLCRIALSAAQWIARLGSNGEASRTSTSALALKTQGQEQGYGRHFSNSISKETVFFEDRRHIAVLACAARHECFQRKRHDCQSGHLAQWCASRLLHQF
jgi:hypothetical protein